MVAQLNRFMALLVLFWLLTQPAMAAPDGYQTLVVDGDTLVVQIAEPLPTGYQTIVVDGDTLTVQVLAEPLPTDDPLSAASDDSLSAQTGIVRTGETEKSGLAQAAPAVNDSTEQKIRKRPVNRLALFGISIIGGTLIGAELGPVVLKEPDCPNGSFFKCDLRDLEGGLLGFLAGLYIGIILASDSPNQVETPSKPDEARRFSVGIGPDTRGRLSAVAALRF